MSKTGIVISAVFPKGGEWKSTLIQTVSTSEPFKPYKVGVLEADAQTSISDWLKERDSSLPDLPIKVFKYNEEQELKESIERYKHGLDFLFVDLPGESKTAKLSRSALAYSDMCITPLRIAAKPIQAFENHFLQMAQLILDLRIKTLKTNPFFILPTFAHTSTRVENQRKHYERYDKYFNIMESIHRDRLLFTYFSQGGFTLEEYAESVKSDKGEHKTALKGISEVNAIANEILSIVS